MFKRTQGVRSVCRGGQSIPKSNSMGGKRVILCISVGCWSVQQRGSVVSKVPGRCRTSHKRSIRKNKIAINNLI